jgi:glycosyltransferase involved in cell wall biosynthesis
VSAPASVTVVVPVRDGAETIGDLLAALGAQVPPPAAAEIVVVDNGSTDGTADIVRRFDVRLAQAQTPGPSAARNVGLAVARGDVVAYLDADTLPTRRWLVEILAPFEDPAVVLVGGATIGFAPETPAQRFVASQMEASAFEHSVSRALFPFAASRNLAVRCEPARAVGGWAEDMPTAEDMDFCFRLSRATGAPLAHSPGAIVLHRDRASDRALRDQAWSYGEGLAHMYLRYPEVAGWDAAKTGRLVRILAVRSSRPWALRLRGRPADSAQVELARYHALWTWWFWRGFFSMLGRRRRTAPPPWRDGARWSLGAEGG